MNSLTIPELQEKKKETEQNIEGILMKFKDETGVSIESVYADINTLRTLGGCEEQVINIKVNVIL